ncbi:MAG: type I methionyl aminopeptidase [Clostridiales bacterium]|jgi:methionyl aminopeptidase|nr:type I methionyl aminopeptidase [Clostridiales bacterium]
MISVKSRREIDLMRRAGDILARCFQIVEPLVKEGVPTREIERAADVFIRKNDGLPSFRGQPGLVEGAPDFPAAACISVNEEVIHGIPGARKLKSGDIVSIDMGVLYKGYHSDMARTFRVGSVSELAERLIRVTEESFWQAAAAAVPGNRVSDISRVVQRCVEAAGFSVVRDFVGHGIGTELHEEPQIPNFVERRERRGGRLQKGMTLAVEPMVNAGACDVDVMSNKWTIVTRDGSLSAHYENTLLVCDGAPELLSVAV